MALKSCAGKRRITSFRMQSWWFQSVISKSRKGFYKAWRCIGRCTNVRYLVLQRRRQLWERRHVRRRGWFGFFRRKAGVAVERLVPHLISRLSLLLYLTRLLCFSGCFELPFVATAANFLVSTGAITSAGSKQSLSIFSFKWIAEMYHPFQIFLKDQLSKDKAQLIRISSSAVRYEALGPVK